MDREPGPRRRLVREVEGHRRDLDFFLSRRVEMGLEDEIAACGEPQGRVLSEDARVPANGPSPQVREADQNRPPYP